MSYPGIIKYLESFINYEQIPAYPYQASVKLERIRDFLGTIGNPQDSLKCIHIAGTKGKGSTSVFAAYILRAAGYRVGLYTSPHLYDFRERIRILEHQSSRAPRHQIEQDFEGMISKGELGGLVERLKPAIDEYNKNSEYGPLSFFEAYTSLAFVYFKKKQVDFVVLETGLGGRLDATNVVNPLVCAITPISYEHTQKLGNTLRKIAAEKAGIIKSSYQLSAISYQPKVITAPQEKEALAVIRKRCKKMKADLCEVGRDIKYKKTNNGFSIRGMFGRYPDLKIKLPGRHQIVNAVVATGSVEALRSIGINISPRAIKRGLYATLWPGRCEAVSRNPLVILDGAQNIASSRALKYAVRENFKYNKLILILGVSSDKDIKGICNELSDLADKIILTRANSPRAAETAAIARYFQGKDLCITDNVKEAKVKALQLARKEDLILVTGSLFVVGEFRKDNEKHN